MKKLYNNSATPVVIQYGHTSYYVGAYNYVEVDDGVLVHIQPPIVGYTYTEVSEGVDTAAPVYGAAPYPSIIDITDAWTECAESATPHVHLNGKCEPILHAWDVAAVPQADVLVCQTSITAADTACDDAITDIDSALSSLSVILGIVEDPSTEHTAADSAVTSLNAAKLHLNHASNGVIAKLEDIAAYLNVVLTDSDLDAMTEAELDAFNAANGTTGVDYATSYASKLAAAKVRLAEITS